MKKYLAILFFIGSAAASVWGFDPDSLNTVTIQNGLNADIQYLFVKPEDAAVWGPDVLGSEHTLSPGDSYSFNILYMNESADFTFLAIDENDVSYMLSDVTITDGVPAKLKLTTRTKINQSFDFSFTTVKLTNTLDYDINYLFCSPDESEHYGADMLDSETILEAGETLAFLVPVKRTTHKYNVMAVDEDNDKYTFNISISSKDDTHSYDIEASDMDTD